MKKTALFILAAVLVAGCANTPQPTVTMHTMGTVIENVATEVVEENSIPPGTLLYFQTDPDDVNAMTLTAIVYVQKKPTADGREVVVLVAGASEDLWKDLAPAAVGAGGRVAGAYVYGANIEAAKTFIAQHQNASADNKGVSSSSSSTANPQVSNDTDVDSTNNNQNITNSAADDVDACSGSDACQQN